MNGKQAKRIRREVYGDDYSPKFRQYGAGKGLARIADPRRQAYQKMKKESQRRQ
jgi:hypothetical protein